MRSAKKTSLRRPELIQQYWLIWLWYFYLYFLVGNDTAWPSCLCEPLLFTLFCLYNHRVNSYLDIITEFMFDHVFSSLLNALVLESWCFTSHFVWVEIRQKNHVFAITTHTSRLVIKTILTFVWFSPLRQVHLRYQQVSCIFNLLLIRKPSYLRPISDVDRFVFCYVEKVGFWDFYLF